MHPALHGSQTFGCTNLCKFSQRAHSLASRVCHPPLPDTTSSLLFVSPAHSQSHLLRLFAVAAMQRRCCVLICSGDESPRLRCRGLEDVQLSSTTTLSWCLSGSYNIVHFHYPYVLLRLCPTQVWRFPSTLSPLCLERKPADVKAPPTPPRSPACGLCEESRLSDEKEDSMKLFCFFFSSKTDAPAVKMFFFFFSIVFFFSRSHPLNSIVSPPSPVNLVTDVQTTTVVDHVPPPSTSFNLLWPLTSFVFTNPQWSVLRHISCVSIHLSIVLSAYRYTILMSIKSQAIFRKTNNLCIVMQG